MRLLVLGGTAFVGRAVASRAVAAGYEVVCAARGRSGPVPVGATLVRLDRDALGGLAPLDGQRFDAVVDVSSRPSQVRAAVAALAGRVGHWCYPEPAPRASPAAAIASPTGPCGWLGAGRCSLPAGPTTPSSSWTSATSRPGW